MMIRIALFINSCNGKVEEEYVDAQIIFPYTRLRRQIELYRRFKERCGMKNFILLIAPNDLDNLDETWVKWGLNVNLLSVKIPWSFTILVSIIVSSSIVILYGSL